MSGSVVGKGSSAFTERVFEILIEHAPNGLRVAHFKTTFQLLDQEASEEEILESLHALETRGLVTLKRQQNPIYPNRYIEFWSLTNPTQYPIREEKAVGDVQFARSISGDLVGAEDLNMFIEVMSKYDENVEKRVSDLASEMTRRYWANIAALLGVFVAVFALILRSTEPLLHISSSSAWVAFKMSLAIVSPLAIVLVAFVLILWLVMRKI